MKNIAFSAVFMAAIAVFSSQISAQQLYRIVGPDGKVTFSDQPPASSSGAKVSTGRAGALNEIPAASAGSLPFELRAVVQRFPVTLYTGKDCVPCDSGRTMLRSRGVPFTERTVESNEDIQAFKRLGGDTLPMASVGGQQMKGYSDSEWSQNLDAAGYPKSSQLPASYRNPAATPLVASRAAPAPVPVAPAAPAATAPAVAPAPAPSNPAGIRF